MSSGRQVVSHVETESDGEEPELREEEHSEEERYSEVQGTEEEEEEENGEQESEEEVTVIRRGSLPEEEEERMKRLHEEAAHRLVLRTGVDTSRRVRQPGKRSVFDSVEWVMEKERLKALQRKHLGKELDDHEETEKLEDIQNLKMPTQLRK
eukprot:TRINITY_DN151_c2_g2_i1.p1 TRINITY_DN151_c2_g2~~TRINITY_DN151_c2_g2_i1.p1  ORF type:complete len:152 (+),score=65.09 TRINITY_DN151_c2_g2_i1:150-605(+)